MTHRRRSLSRNPVIRVVVIWGIQVFAVALMAYSLSTFNADSWWTAVVFVAAIGLLNALLWPILSYVVLPFAVLTLGFFTLILNGLILWLASEFIDGVHVQGLGTAIIVAAAVSAITIIVSGVLTVDDDSSWYRNVVRRRMKRRAKSRKMGTPGVLFLEIDGLARPLLERVVREGYMPTLARWLESGGHRLVTWETDLSSQTSASQAGILLGNNFNIPAFRWYDRGRRKVCASSSPRVLGELEKELSDGDGLLASDGASRGNMFSGDAPNVMATASTISDRSRLHVTDFQVFFISPSNFIRTFLLALWDIVLERWQFWRARRNRDYPILGPDDRGGRYPVLRAFQTVVVRELNVYTLVGDMLAGVPSAYATFVAYDEVAHHSGVESRDAFDQLAKLDRQFARLESASRQAPRPYHFVILSDHGQSGGATFRQRYHMSLEDLVRGLVKEYRVQGTADVHEDWQQVSVFLTEAVNYERAAVSRLLGRVLKRHIVQGDVVLGPDARDLRPDDRHSGDSADIVVLASGNLGLVCSTSLERRATMEEIEAAYPGMLDGLVRHEGIGFAMVHSEEHGPVAIGSKGRYYLAEHRVEGEDPLAGFGLHAAEHLRRTDSFPHAPDILVNSFCNAETNEVAAFEELIGSHGGLGGLQAQAFVLFPAQFELQTDSLIGATAVHQQFKQWLSQMNDSSPNGDSCATAEEPA